jgi:hypothetical protein
MTVRQVISISFQPWSRGNTSIGIALLFKDGQENKSTVWDRSGDDSLPIIARGAGDWGERERERKRERGRCLPKSGMKDRDEEEKPTTVALLLLPDLFPLQLQTERHLQLSLAWAVLPTKQNNWSSKLSLKHSFDSRILAFSSGFFLLWLWSDLAFSSGFVLTLALIWSGVYSGSDLIWCFFSGFVFTLALIWSDLASDRIEHVFHDIDLTLALTWSGIFFWFCFYSGFDLIWCSFLVLFLPWLWSYLIWHRIGSSMFSTTSILLWLWSDLVFFSGFVFTLALIWSGVLFWFCFYSGSDLIWSGIGSDRACFPRHRSVCIDERKRVFFFRDAAFSHATSCSECASIRWDECHDYSANSWSSFRSSDAIGFVRSQLDDINTFCWVISDLVELLQWGLLACCILERMCFDSPRCVPWLFSKQLIVVPELECDMVCSI